jgi:hypothetical protein
VQLCAFALLALDGDDWRNLSPLSMRKANLARLLDRRPAAQAGLALDPNFTIRRFRSSASSDNSTYLAGRERQVRGHEHGRRTGKLELTDVSFWADTVEKVF